MTFRAPPGKKWIYPFLICGFILVGTVVLRLAIDYHRRIGREAGNFGGYVAVLAFLAVGLWVCVYASWSVWTGRVDVGDQGVGWREGKEQRFLKWDEIGSLSRHGRSLAFVETSGKVSGLPFVSRPLYEALTAKLKPLPSEEEAMLFPKR